MQRGSARRSVKPPGGRRPELPGLAAGIPRVGAATAAGRGGIATGMRGETPADAAVPPAASSAERVGIVVCGRRARPIRIPCWNLPAGGIWPRASIFIYELSPDDLPALFRLAHAFVYLPDAGIEASIVPVVEAMRAGVPMVLSDTQLNREAAGDAAAYASALGAAGGGGRCAGKNVLSDANFRREMSPRTPPRRTFLGICRRPPADRHLQFAVKRLAFPKGAVIRKKYHKTLGYFQFNTLSLCSQNNKLVFDVKYSLT